MQRPEFASVVAVMMLVMGIPAIFAALVVKSQSFDKNRYEFDPNKTWSVLEQGRRLHASLEEADKAVKAEMARLAQERKNLVDNVKKLDEAMLALRAVAGTSPAVAQTIPDGPPAAGRGPQERRGRRPAAVAGLHRPARPRSPRPSALAGTNVVRPPCRRRRPSPPPPPPRAAGLPKAEAEAEVAAVPEPQKTIAAMLPLADLPAGWEVGKSGDEAPGDVQRREPVREDRRPRRELRRLQGQGDGLRLLTTRPATTPTRSRSTSSRWATPSRRWASTAPRSPTRSSRSPVGAEGYTAAGSTLFYSGPYYTQIVSTKDDAKFSEFALALARKIADAQKPGGPPAVASVAEGATEARTRRRAQAATPAAAAARRRGRPRRSSPCCRPGRRGRARRTSRNDVFGYSFLSDVFLADYSEGPATWKGFLRAYATPDEAKAVFEKYLASAKQDGAEVKEVEAEGADRMVVVVQHRPLRRDLPQGEHPRRRRRLDRAQARRGVRPRLRQGPPRQGPGGRGRGNKSRRRAGTETTETSSPRPPSENDSASPATAREVPPMSEKLTRTQIKNLERLGGVNPADESFSRRQFVRQVGGTGLVVGGALAAGC